MDIKKNMNTISSAPRQRNYYNVKENINYYEFPNNNVNMIIDSNANNNLNVNKIQNQNLVEEDERKIKVEFQYSEGNIDIYSKLKEIMEEICKNFGKKIHKNIKDIQFLYSGKKINMNKSLIETINKQDKERKIMSIIALDNYFQKQSNNKNIIKANHIICPICKESALINFEDYKIKIFSC